ncbi:MAG: hypothetical protein JO249_07555 [Acidobacteria bacterium]|nr:hypothetical protein [Acidobacteriota bacterium]
MAATRDEDISADYNSRPLGDQPRSHAEGIESNEESLGFLEYVPGERAESGGQTKSPGVMLGPFVSASSSL